ncbi:MAG TPA: hypothetical protein VN635_02865, partial [Conexibacter sp.]|nr:hypothetical protein [Conexibacter sp.]
MTTINRTNIAIAIVGRPRSRADASQPAAIGANNPEPLNSASSRARSPGNSRTAITNASSNNDSTCPPAKTSISRPPRNHPTRRQNSGRYPGQSRQLFPGQIA